MDGILILREANRSDVPAFFEYQQDPVASRQAAFTPSSVAWQDFQEHWDRILDDPDIIKYAVLINEVLVGNVVCFPWEGHREIGYWVDRQYWSRGIATEAVRQFLKIIPFRPLYAAVAADNLASIRVLEKSGFTPVGRKLAFSNARNADVDEMIYRLSQAADH